VRLGDASRWRHHGRTRSQRRAANAEGDLVLPIADFQLPINNRQSAIANQK
jgi:hypothetical protein